MTSASRWPSTGGLSQAAAAPAQDPVTDAAAPDPAQIAAAPDPVRIVVAQSHALNAAVTRSRRHAAAPAHAAGQPRPNAKSLAASRDRGRGPKTNGAFVFQLSFVFEQTYSTKFIQLGEKWVV